MCVFLVFAWFSLFLLFVAIFLIFSYVPSEWTICVGAKPLVENVAQNLIENLAKRLAKTSGIEDLETFRGAYTLLGE